MLSGANNLLMYTPSHRFICKPVPEALAFDQMQRHVPRSRRLLCRRLRYPQPRSRSGGNDVDEGGDDQARFDDNKRKTRREMPDRNASTSSATRSARIGLRRTGKWSWVRARPRCAAAQDKVSDLLVPSNIDPWPEVRKAGQVTARLVQLLWLRVAEQGIRSVDQ